VSITTRDNRFAKISDRIVKFYNETRSELRKVVWPTRKEWTNLTILVIAVSIAVGAALGLVDWAFEKAILFIIPGR
jgi:preprotein translocase subunit SecE